MPKEKTTIYDIAARAEVSVATVSRVINGTASVAQGKRERVLAAINEADYRPSALARGLVSNRLCTIGLMVPDIADPYYARLAFEIEQEAAAQGYSMLLHNTVYPRLSRVGATDTPLLRRIRGLRADGFIIMGDISDAIFPDISHENARDDVPFVTIGQTSRRANLPGVFCDVDYAIRSVVGHFDYSGYRSVGFITNRDGDGRDAFLEAARESGMQVKQEWNLSYGGSPEAGAAAMARLIATGDIPRAIFAASDMVAVGCLSACGEAGLSVPGDVALAGCGNTAVSMYTHPRLTTIDLHTAWVAREAVSCLLGLLDGRDAGGATDIRPDLVIRESSAPVRRGKARG